MQSRRSVRHGARPATSFEGLGFAHSMADAERSSGTASLKDRRSREAAEDRALEAAEDRWPETSGASGTPWLGKRATRSLLALGRRSDGTRRRRPATRQSTSGCRAATVSREAWSSPRAAEEVAAVGRSSPRAAEEVAAVARSRPPSCGANVHPRRERSEPPHRALPAGHLRGRRRSRRRRHRALRPCPPATWGWELPDRPCGQGSSIHRHRDPVGTGGP